MRNTLDVSSFNGNGLRNSLKLEQIVISLKADILCVQETHWTKDMMDKIKKVWTDHVFVSHGTEKARGVATMIKKGAVNNIKQVFNDKEGRILVVEFEFQNVLFRLINLYAPNVETDRTEMFKKLKPLCKGHCIVVGDFNVWCTKLDASSSTNFRHDMSRKEIMDILQNENMMDIWRHENPERMEFSRRQMVLGKLKESRIDLCLVKREILSYVNKTEYKFIGHSDHAAIIFKLGLNEGERGGGTVVFKF